MSISVPLPMLESDFFVRETFFGTVPAFTQVARPDSSRYAIGFATATPANMFLSTAARAAVQQGVLLTTLFPLIWLNFRDHGPLVGRAWFNGPTDIADPLTVFEVFWRPGRKE